MMKYPILYKKGYQEFYDIPIENVNKYWAEHYLHLKEHWELWMNFLEKHPQYDKKYLKRSECIECMNAWCEYVKSNRLDKSKTIV